MIRIAIDCMGGDNGVSVTVPAAVRFAHRIADVHFLLVGDETKIKKSLNHSKPRDPNQFEIIPCNEVITGEDAVESALRHKKGSTMHVAINLVSEQKADACISAGNTGALMAISRLILKTLDGIKRPAIASAIPNISGGGTYVLDLGANVDCTPQHLQQFAIMGTALVQAIEEIDNPTLGLLNIGHETHKGNDVVRKTYTLLQESGLNFIGNVEGDDIFKSKCNVVVCDGFVGNVMLKTSEGLAKMISQKLKKRFLHSFFTKLIAFIAKPVLSKFKEEVDNRRYNGAVFLGLKGVVVKSHGSADSLAFKHAIYKAYSAIKFDILNKISIKVGELQSTEVSEQISNNTEHA